jgi:hypothetical protein
MGARDFGDQLLGRLLDYAMQSIPTALGIGVSLADARQPRLVASIGVAEPLDRAQWEAGEGPTWEALRTGKTVILPLPDDGPGPLRLERWAGMAERVDSALVEKVQGLVVTPGEWGGDLPMVLSAYLDQPPLPRVVGEVDGHEALIANALAVVEYCAGEEMRAEQMLQMSQYRRVIEQAKGLIMSALGVDGAAAFAVLSRASQHFNVRLRSLAVALVEHVGAGPAEHPDDVESVVIPGEADRRVAAQVWMALSASGSARPSGLFLPDGPSVPETPVQQ